MTVDLDPGRFKRAMLAYARASGEYRRRIAETLSEIHNIIDKHGDRVYVACSGGKDSLVLLHLAARVKPDVKVFHWDHGPYLMPRLFEDEILRAIRAVAPRARLRVETSKRLWEPDARWDYKRWYRAFWQVVDEMVRNEWSVVLLGLRGEEGVARRLRVETPCREARGGIECYPLREWTWRDVWAYIFEHGIPYPSPYDEKCPLQGWDRCRLVTFFDEEFAHLEGNLDSVLFWRYKHVNSYQKHLLRR